MTDYKIRIALKRKILSRHTKNPNATVIDDLGFKHGAGHIDLVAVNKVLHGYVIKSGRDTLNRLSYQARAYNLVFDRITLVASGKKLFNAIKLIPEWWGVLLIDKGAKGAVSFFTIRKPKNNPSLDPFSIVKLLWKHEALIFLDEISTSKGFRSKPKKIIYNQIIKLADLNTIRSWVRQQLKKRLYL